MSEPVEPLAARPLTDPHPDRLSRRHPDYEAIVRAHEAALRVGEDTYVDPPTGLTRAHGGLFGQARFLL